MKIGVVSDTHGSVIGWQKVQEEFSDADIILHAGDILSHGPKNPMPAGYEPMKLAELINSCHVPLLITKGNCDAEVDSLFIELPIIPGYILLQVGKNLRIICTHGHNFTEESQLNFAKRIKANLFIFGHTHIPSLFEKEGIIFLNPGSPAIALSPQKYLSCAVCEYKEKTLQIKIKELTENFVLQEKSFSLNPLNKPSICTTCQALPN